MRPETYLFIMFPFLSPDASLGSGSEPSGAQLPVRRRRRISPSQQYGVTSAGWRGWGHLGGEEARKV